jgi:hypothetical protein
VAVFLYEFSFVTEVSMHRTPVVDLDALPREERIRRYRVAAKVMRIFAAKVLFRCEYYLARAIEYDRLADEEEKRVGDP